MTVPNTNQLFYRAGCLLFLLLLSHFAQAQKNRLGGTVRDTAEKKTLPYAIVALIDEADTTLYTSVRTNTLGEFEIEKIPAGTYTLMISYPRMADYLQSFTISDTSKIKLGKIDMVTRATLMQEVIVKSGQPIRMRGDTLEYTADSFAVRPGANVKELLKRLPGIQVDRLGKIIAQGKEVKKILVDGDEFFTDDPKMVTEFLGADAIDKVQVFDKKSDAANFTGIDDGSRTKTINLQLKKNKKNGAFGKASAGSNGDQYYDNQAMASFFQEFKKMSVFGLMSKTGKEGISYNDLGQYVNQDYERIDDGSNNYYSSNTDYENENYYGNGIPSVTSGGAHYSNKWMGGREKLFSNYRIKQINAAGWNSGSGTMLLPDNHSFYNENYNTESSKNFSQKASGALTVPLDSFSTVKISVNGGLGNGTRKSGGESLSRNEKNFIVSTSSNSTRNESDNKKMGSNIAYQRRFRKEGRTLSLLVQQDVAEVNNNDYNYSGNKYFDAATGAFTKADTLDQLQSSYNNSRSYAAKVSGTEQLSKELRLFAEYGWKTVAARNKFKTYNNNNGSYTSLLDTLSNDYDFTIRTNIAGTSLGWQHKKITATVGTKIYLTGFQQVDHDSRVSKRRNFTNLAPQVILNINLKENTSIGINYSGETFQPSVTQLQPLRKSSNPLYVEIGNPDLQPGFNHNLGISYNKNNWPKGRSFYTSLSAVFVENGITSNTNTDAQNRNTIQYVNLQQRIPQTNLNLSYGWFYKNLHLRPTVALNGSLAGSNYISNGVIIENKNYYSTLTFLLNYDLESKMALGYSGSLNYNRSTANLPGNINRQTITHSHSINGIKYFPHKFELSSDCVFNFQPANGSFDKSFNTVRWNAALEKKFFKNDRGFARFSANDLLNNNTGYSRSISGTGVYESNSLTIRRYFLLTVGWNFIKSLNSK